MNKYHVKWIGTVFSIIAVAMALWLHLLARTGALQPLSSTSASPSIDIQLDLQPFKDPVSTLVLLRRDGKARALRYNRYQLILLAATEGVVQSAKLSSVLNKTRDPAFREAILHRDFTGQGLSQGDQFHLYLKSQGGADEEIFGFVSDTPSVVRSLVEELLTLSKHFDQAPLAEAYVRSKPIARERFETLRREGKLRFVPIIELPSDLQPIIAGALNQGGNFISLSKAQHGRLLELTSHGHDFFVIDQGSGYQLTLFQSVR